MQKKLTTCELRMGDVFLYNNTSFVSRMIASIDGSQYSHASIYCYEGNVLEAVADGVIKRSIKESIKDAKYVNVFRFITSDGDGVIGDSEHPVQPLIDSIRHYESDGARYAYEQIFLLFFLATTRRLQIPIVSWMLRNILDHAASILNQIAQAGKEPMICSELVYRCFDDAGANYKLTIRGADTIFVVPPNISTEEDGKAPGQDLAEAETDLTNQMIEDFFAKYAAAKNKVVGQPGAETSRTVSTLKKSLAVADFVTPRDLKKCPNLKLIGRLVL